MIADTSNQNLLTYKTFSKKEDLIECTNLLKENGIQFFIENNTNHFDPSMTNTTPVEIVLKLNFKDFEKVDNLYRNEAENNILKLPSDYYLFSFSIDELKKIISKPDEWGPFDYSLAKKLLKNQNIEYTEKDISQIKINRIEELSKPDDPAFYWILIGFGISFLGGFIGIIWGWFLMTHKKTLPNGLRVMGYSQKYQKFGFFMMIFGIAMLVYWLLFRFDFIYLFPNLNSTLWK